MKNDDERVRMFKSYEERVMRFPSHILQFRSLITVGWANFQHDYSIATVYCRQSQSRCEHNNRPKLSFSLLIFPSLLVLNALNNHLFFLHDTHSLNSLTDRIKRYRHSPSLHNTPYITTRYTHFPFFFTQFFGYAIETKNFGFSFDFLFASYLLRFANKQTNKATTTNKKSSSIKKFVYIFICEFFLRKRERDSSRTNTAT